MLESETARVSWARGMALLLPLSLDAWGESPANWHPVVWFGRLIRRLERSAPGGRGAESLYGGTMLLLTAPCALLPAWLLQRLALRLARELARRRPPNGGTGASGVAGRRRPCIFSLSLAAKHPHRREIMRGTQ